MPKKKMLPVTVKSKKTGKKSIGRTVEVRANNSLYGGMESYLEEPRNKGRSSKSLEKAYKGGRKRSAGRPPRVRSIGHAQDAPFKAKAIKNRRKVGKKK
jgi:hypothetical protein